MEIGAITFMILGFVFGVLFGDFLNEKSRKKVEHTRNKAFARSLSEIIVELHMNGNNDLREKIEDHVYSKRETIEKKVANFMRDSLFKYCSKKKIHPRSVVFGLNEKETPKLFSKACVDLISQDKLLSRSNTYHVKLYSNDYENLIQWDETRFKYLSNLAGSSCLGLEHDLIEIDELRHLLDDNSRNIDSVV